ncbi:hypothetical protein GGH94_000988 [Coemansia aciculifera]|uniref:Calreticulin n=1 Tax=Coemansia aciculifera TaxID=417176 RepID=A0A9W8M6V4_9FUNG|nr:hypothetical protein GGH94_000988 [Coemansia aciculifera]
MRCSVALAALAALASSALARVYYEETFSAPDSIDSFKATKARDDVGAIKLSRGEWYGNENGSGLQIAEDARFYAYSAKLKRPFNTKGKDFVVQFTVKYEQDIDCGGAYLKLLPPTLDPTKFDGDSEYEVMFGPDICGSTNRRVHAIINYNGTNQQIDKVIQPRGDQLTHQYTFWVKPDKTFEIRIDNKVQEEGKVEDFWKVLPEKQIPDPDAEKPEDWVDGPVMINDTEDVKPEDWVDGPATIPDPDATRPEDWDDDMDGDWEAPVIANPEFKGEWKARQIKNPAYQGEWTAPMIDNPAYEEDEDLAVFNIGYVGIDIWTVKSGTIFNNILITDDIDYASKFGNSTWADFVESEIAAKKVVDDIESKKLEEERKAKEAAAKEAEEKEKAEAKEADVDADIEADADVEPASKAAAADDVFDELDEDDEDKVAAERAAAAEKLAAEEAAAAAEETAAAEKLAAEEAAAAAEKKAAAEKLAAVKAAKAKAAKAKTDKAKADKKASKKKAAKEAARKAKQAAEEAAKKAAEAEKAAVEDEDEDTVAHDEL